MKGKTKVETIEEYVARGGTIKRYPSQETNSNTEVSRKPGGPVVIMSLDEADLFYGEGKSKKKAKQQSVAKFDASALPEQLRKKFLSKLKDEDGE